MRTTVNLDDELLQAAKRRALELGSTLSAVIEGALRLALSGEHNEQAAPAPPFRLVTFCGDGLQPGVNLDKTSSLLEEDDLARVEVTVP